MPREELPTVRTLDELAELVAANERLYLRWSRGPDADDGGQSRDELTGAVLPGLCASPLAVEEWWGDRPMRTWVARRVYDYEHLKHERGPGVRPWILEGDELGRGPDNEPIVGSVRPVALVDDALVAEANDEIEQRREDWGPLRRS